MVSTSEKRFGAGAVPTGAVMVSAMARPLSRSNELEGESHSKHVAGGSRLAARKVHGSLLFHSVLKVQAAKKLRKNVRLAAVQDPTSLAEVVNGFVTSYVHVPHPVPAPLVGVEQ